MSKGNLFVDELEKRRDGALEVAELAPDNSHEELLRKASIRWHDDSMRQLYYEEAPNFVK